MPVYKNCPYCSEQILSTAKKCKHCGEFMNKKDRPKSGYGEFTSDLGKGIGCLVIGVVILFVLYFLSMVYGW